MKWGDLGDGHISARDPERTDCFWMLRYGVSYDDVKVSDLVLVGPDGKLAEGRGGVNFAGYYIHQPILEARPDLVSAVHVHTGWGTPFSSEARLFDPISQESCIFFEDHALLYRTPSELDEFADQLSALQPVLASLENDPSLVQLAELVRLGFDSEQEAEFEPAQWSSLLDQFGAATVSVYEEAPVRISAFCHVASASLSSVSRTWSRKVADVTNTPWAGSKTA